MVESGHCRFGKIWPKGEWRLKSRRIGNQRYATAQVDSAAGDGGAPSRGAWRSSKGRVLRFCRPASGRQRHPHVTDTSNALR